MRVSIRSFARAALLASALLHVAGCGGEDGAAGAAGSDAIVSTAIEPAGGNCGAVAGVRIDTGVDADGDGLLDPGEIAATRYVCDGEAAAAGASAIVETADEPGGANCADGGIRIDAGIDADGNGVLDPGEGTTRYVCDGSNGTDGTAALVLTADEPSGANCPNGGVRIDAGADANANGALDPGEGTTRYVCDGADGTAGVDGAAGADGADGVDGSPALVFTADEPPGAHCADGGVRIDSGNDANRNGALDAGEGTTRYVCDGAAGADPIVVASPEPAGPHCEHGGTRIDAGLDGDGSGTLEPAEITSTSWVCGADTLHPSVVAVAPAVDELAVAVSQAFAVSFSEAIDPATLDAEALSLRIASDGSPVEASLSWDEATWTATLTPAAPLARMEVYELVVTSRVRDLAGNSLDQPQAWTFLVSIDDLPPSLAGVTPSDGGTIAPSGAVAAVFDEPLAESSAAGARLTLVDGAGDPVPGVRSHDAAAGWIAWTPEAPLVVGETYTASLFAVAADAFGNVATVVHTWSFTAALPALTGTPGIAASVAVGQEVTARIPVNEATAEVSVSLATDAAGIVQPLGSFPRATPWDTEIVATFVVPEGTPEGDYALLIDAAAPAFAVVTHFLWLSPVSATHYVLQADGLPDSDSGIPLAMVQVTPAVPGPADLLVSLDAVVAGASPGTLDVTYTVVNAGGAAAGPFALGLFANVPWVPELYWAPDVWVDVDGLAAGASATATVPVPDPSPGSTIVGAFADLEGRVAEGDEGNNAAVHLPAAAATATLGAPVPIADYATTLASLSVGGAPSRLRYLTVTLDVTHTWDDDLRITLVAPSGTEVLLFDSRGGSGDDLAGTVFDQAAPISIAEGVPAFTGTFRPEGNLAVLLGEDANGTWTLRLQDLFAGDTGTLDGWTLAFW